MSQRKVYTINNANRIERKFLPTCKVLQINLLELEGVYKQVHTNIFTVQETQILRCIN